MEQIVSFSFCVGSSRKNDFTRSICVCVCVFKVWTDLSVYMCVYLCVLDGVCLCLSNMSEKKEERRKKKEGERIKG